MKVSQGFKVGFKAVLKASNGFSSMAPLASLALCALVVSSSAYAQVTVPGGKSMMSELPFISNFASTAMDIALLIAKVGGGCLAVFGIFQVGKRDWNKAIAALGGGTALFFAPQIMAAMQKLGGG